MMGEQNPPIIHERTWDLKKWTNSFRNTSPSEKTEGPM